MPAPLTSLTDWVKKDEWPHLACPACTEGFLTPRELHTVEDTLTASLRNHDGWEPEWITGIFHGVLACSLTKCGAVIAVGGEFKVDEDLSAEGHWFGEYTEFLLLKYASPGLRLLEVPAATPTSVVDSIASASLVLWADPSSAANRLRVAVETLLTELGQKRTRIAKPKDGSRGKRVPLQLNERIETYRKSNEQVGDALLAVKWIGNSGSHDSQLTALDVLDGADMLKFALRLLYDKTDDQLRKRIDAVNRRRGLPRTRKPS